MSLGWPEQLHERTQEVLTLRQQVSSLTARVAELEEIAGTDKLDLFYKLKNEQARSANRETAGCQTCRKQIADLTAQLSSMTQERDAYGAQRDEAGKQLMDCQYKLADVTAKLAAKSAQLNDLLNDAVDVAQAEMRAVTAEIALREARAVLTHIDWYFGLMAGSGNFMGDEEHEAWGKTKAALSAAPQTEAPQEVCICAAIRMPSGEVIHGHRHNHCYDVVRARTDAVREDIVAAEQGFVTSQNRFVGRKEAMRIQRESGLPSCYRKDGKYFGDELTRIVNRGTGMSGPTK